MEGDVFQLPPAGIQNPVFFGDRSHDLLLALENIEPERAEFLSEKGCRFGMSRLPERPIPICQDQRTILFNGGVVKGGLE